MVWTRFFCNLTFLKILDFVGGVQDFVLPPAHTDQKRAEGESTALFILWFDSAMKVHQQLQNPLIFAATLPFYNPVWLISMVISLKSELFLRSASLLLKEFVDRFRLRAVLRLESRRRNFKYDHRSGQTQGRGGVIKHCFLDVYDCVSKH